MQIRFAFYVIIIINNIIYDAHSDWLLGESDFYFSGWSWTNSNSLEAMWTHKSNVTLGFACLDTVSRQPEKIEIEPLTWIFIKSVAVKAHSEKTYYSHVILVKWKEKGKERTNKSVIKGTGKCRKRDTYLCSSVGSGDEEKWDQEKDEEGQRREAHPSGPGE